MIKPTLRTVLAFMATLLVLGGAPPAIAETVEYDGLIEPYEVIDIGVPDPGIVRKICVDRGSDIEKGQILVLLDASVEQAEFEKAKSMAAFKGDVDFQATQLDFAKRVNNRLEHLTVISAHDRDQAATDVILTQYRLQKARENRIIAQKDLEKAKVALDRRSIQSPVSGVVVERYVSPGEFVSNQPLLRLARINPLRVEVIVPAFMFGRIQPGMIATIVPELQSYGEKTAKVKLVDRVIDSASSTFGVRLELINDGHQVPSGLKCLVRFDFADGDSVEKAKDVGRNSALPEQ